MAENVIGKVGVLVGRVFAENADGVRRELKLNDPIFAEDVIITFGGGRVEVFFGPNHTFLVAEDQRITLDSTIYGDGDPEATRLAVLERDSQGNFGIETQIANNTDSLDHLLTEATAAGFSAGGDASSHSNIDTLSVLGRVAEFVQVGSLYPGAPVTGNAQAPDGARPASLSAEPGSHVLSVSAAQVLEGGDLVHNVVLSNRSDHAQSFNFAINFENGSPSEVGTPQFSHGVTLLNGQLQVPAGVTEFTITLSTLNDHLAGPDHTLNLVVGGVTVHDVIVDAGASPMRFGAETLAFHLGEPVQHAPIQVNQVNQALNFHDVLGSHDHISAALGPAHPVAAVAAPGLVHLAHLDLAAVLAPALHDGLHSAHKSHD
jgi:hypothetical protein